MKQLIDSLNTIVPLNDSEIAYLMQHIKTICVKRKKILLREGEICQHYIFIHEGCLKIYGVDENGCSHIMQFAAEGEWITDEASFYNKTKSSYHIETIENAIITLIKRDSLYSLFHHTPKFNRIFKVITEQKYTKLQNRTLLHFSTTAEKRYELFLNQNKHLANRLSNTQIASYLGITPQFLSMIRKKRTTKENIY